MPPPRLFGVVGELDGDGHDQIELGQRATCPLTAGPDRRQEHVSVFGHEGVAEPPVGDLTGQLQALRAEGGDHDRERIDRRCHRSDAPARARKRESIDDAVVLEPVAAGDLAHDLDRVADRPERLVERYAVPRLHDPRTARAQTEHESSAGHLLDRHRLHRQHRRRPGTDLHDAGAQPDRRGVGSQMGERRQGVVPPRLGNPHRTRPDPLGPDDELDVVGGGDSGADTDLHDATTYPSAAPCQGVRQWRDRR